MSFDKDKCEIILSNLLINALKHSPQDTEITITSELLPEEKEYASPLPTKVADCSR